MTPEVRAAIVVIRQRLGAYTFQVATEAELQRLILATFAHEPPITTVSSEVRAGWFGRYDIVVDYTGVRVVLELKLKASVGEVERQVLRYAQDETVHAIMLVTTSRRLAIQVQSGGDTVGGKPFVAIAVRGAIG